MEIKPNFLTPPPSYCLFPRWFQNDHSFLRTLTSVLEIVPYLKILSVIPSLYNISHRSTSSLDPSTQAPPPLDPSATPCDTALVPRGYVNLQDPGGSLYGRGPTPWASPQVTHAHYHARQHLSEMTTMATLCTRAWVRPRIVPRPRETMRLQKVKVVFRDRGEGPSREHTRG